MSNTVVVGMQWGDEGKGKVVDLLCPAFDLVARYQGGHNAGHTVKFGDRHFSLHLIPSGILHEGTRCVLGNGMVIAPDAFFAELDRLAESGVDADGRLFISDRAQILLPIHAALDRAREAARGAASIGTTSRGIGPAYEAKVNRFGLRAADLVGNGLEACLASQLEHFRRELAAAPRAAEVDAEALSLEPLLAEAHRWAARLEPYLRDTGRLLYDAWQAGERILFEGAQGALLDIDHGTFPYVTSSSTTAAGAAAGTGMPPRSLDHVVGILKAYTSRVGGGPFVTELHDATGEALRERGHEFGTTTGRPRRCGWLDLVASRYARRINGVDAIALTKLDILDGLDDIPVCVAYKLAGREIEDVPADVRHLAGAEPVYAVLPGWRRPTTGVLDFEQLPAEAKTYVRFIEDQVGAPVALVSTGPRREETILRRDNGVLDRLLGERIARVLPG